VAFRVYADSFATEGAIYDAMAWAYIGYNAVPIPTVSISGTDGGATVAALHATQTHAEVAVAETLAEVVPSQSGVD
jgi:hypothetical protein